MSKIAPTHQAMQCKACWPNTDGLPDNWIRASDEFPEIGISYAWCRNTGLKPIPGNTIIGPFYSGVDVFDGPTMHNDICAFGMRFSNGSNPEYLALTFWTPIPVLPISII